MATEVRQDIFEAGRNLPKRVAQADGIFQIGVGLGMLVDGSALASWLNVSVQAVWIAAFVALLSGAVTLYFARRVNMRLLRFGAIANFVGVIVIAVALALAWNSVLNEGRWALAFLADGFLILGVAESFVRRYMA